MTRKLRYYTPVSRMLAKDMKTLGQKQKFLLLTEIEVASISAFSCTDPQAPVPRGQREEGQVTPAHAMDCNTEEEL